MSNDPPAAVNASPRYLRSAVSHRTDDFESGRITPTLPVTGAAVVPVLPAVVGVAAVFEFLLLPHAARTRGIAITANADLRIDTSFPPGVAGRSGAVGRGGHAGSL